MADPEAFCTVPWTHDGHNEVRVVDGGDLSRAERDSLSWAFSRAILGAATVSALTMAIAQIAVERGPTAQVMDPDDSGDPSRPAISVLLLTPESS